MGRTRVNTLWRRVATLLAAGGLAASLLPFFGVATVFAANADGGCTTLGGNDGGVLGTCTVSVTTPVSGTVNVGENLVLANGAHLDATATQPAGFTLNVTGNMTMQTGSIIEGDDDGLVDGPNGGGSPLTIAV